MRATEGAKKESAIHGNKIPGTPVRQGAIDKPRQPHTTPLKVIYAKLWSAVSHPIRPSARIANAAASQQSAVDEVHTGKASIHW